MRRAPAVQASSAPILDRPLRRALENGDRGNASALLTAKSRLAIWPQARHLTSGWVPAFARGCPGKLHVPNQCCRSRESGDPHGVDAERISPHRTGVEMGPRFRGDDNLDFEPRRLERSLPASEAAILARACRTFPGQPCAFAGTTTWISSFDACGGACQASPRPARAAPRRNQSPRIVLNCRSPSGMAAPVLKACQSSSCAVPEYSSGIAIRARSRRQVEPA